MFHAEPFQLAYIAPSNVSPVPFGVDVCEARNKVTKVETRKDLPVFPCLWLANGCSKTKQVQYFSTENLYMFKHYIHNTYLDAEFSMVTLKIGTQQ